MSKTVSSGQQYIVSSGQYAVGTVVLNGGLEVVEHGGQETNGRVSAGGSQYVYGVANGQWVYGFQII
ncbi:MAG: hypothetical protein JSS43_13010, partial [Proteobacteria bacterium]|nr:hypothetical protein [Pseudomonadota bacterium]